MFARIPRMDPWKPVRLWLWIAGIAAILVAGGWARLRWGVPENYGPWRTGRIIDLANGRSTEWVQPGPFSPFERLSVYFYNLPPVQQISDPGPFCPGPGPRVILVSPRE